MDYNRIENLLDRYWCGDTSIEEERELKRFFSTHTDLPEALEQHRKWFAGTYGITSTKLSNDFDSRILAAIESEENTMTEATGSARRYKITPLRSLLFAAVSVAAMLILYFSLPTKEEFVINENEMTYAEAQQALEKVKEMLYFTSEKINEAEEMTQKNLCKIDVINDYVNINTQ
ncbi:hypothetical protein LJC54_05705 [Parabacteroides sp. OttesenSCG-928-J18]|nr:hypothetical protein [Parabacteroides sp. OttesenSCG-928-J18]